MLANTKGQDLVQHLRATASVARAMGERLGLSEGLVRRIYVAALLHDIGKATTSFQHHINLDLSELQFLSLSEIYDRKAVDPNHLDAYLQGLKATLGSDVTGKAFYIKNTAVGGLPEEGILLTSDQVKALIVEFFKRLLDLEILRGACGRAWLDSLEIMPKESGLDKKDWVKITDASEALKGIDEVHSFYDAYNEEEALKLYEGIDTGKQKQVAVKKAKKVPKATGDTQNTQAV